MRERQRKRETESEGVHGLSHCLIRRPFCVALMNEMNNISNGPVVPLPFPPSKCTNERPFFHVISRFNLSSPCVTMASKMMIGTLIAPNFAEMYY